MFTCWNCAGDDEEEMAEEEVAAEAKGEDEDVDEVEDTGVKMKACHALPPPPTI